MLSTKRWIWYYATTASFRNIKTTSCWPKYCCCNCLLCFSLPFSTLWLPSSCVQVSATPGRRCWRSLSSFCGSFGSLSLFPILCTKCTFSWHVQINWGWIPSRHLKMKWRRPEWTAIMKTPQIDWPWKCCSILSNNLSASSTLSLCSFWFAHSRNQSKYSGSKRRLQTSFRSQLWCANRHQTLSKNGKSISPNHEQLTET